VHQQQSSSGVGSCSVSKFSNISGVPPDVAFHETALFVGSQKSMNPIEVLA